MHPDSTEDTQRWQQEADLLAEGREVVERMCSKTAHRYLYPEGPSLALLLTAFQEFDRMRTVGRVRGGPWRRKRRFKALVRRHVRDDIQSRSRRLSHGYPQPRLRPLPSPPAVIERALARVDADVRPLVQAQISGAPDRMGMALSDDGRLWGSGPASRALEQFREAVINEALADPDSIRGLHVQHLHMVASAPPVVRRHPIATLLLVKLPLQLVFGLVALLVVAYFGAYVFFNDAVLGSFVSARVSGLLEGDLDMKRIHWRPRLIVDLVTGTPSPVVVEDITVWSPYKHTNHGREHRSAHAEQLDVRIILGEIIPWTRLGLPAFLDIPWVLHFTELRNEGEFWLDVREYRDTLTDGTEVTYLSLINAFRPLAPDPDRQGLSFQIDDAVLDGLEVEVDSMSVSRWRAGAQLDDAHLSLSFEAPDPRIRAPIELPLTFSVEAQGSRGSMDIIGIEFDLRDIELYALESGGGTVPHGDVAYRLDAEAAGSQVSVEGTLRDAFGRLNPLPREPPPRVKLAARSADGDRVLAHVIEGLDLPPTTVVGNDTSLSATVTGQLADPAYSLYANGLSLDLMEEAAWIADDVEVQLSMATAPIPGMWADRLDPDESRSIVVFDTLQGTALDGTFELATRPPEDPTFPDAASREAHVVMPLFEEDGYLISIPLKIEGLNPAQLVPTDPDLAPTLSGVASGGVDLERLAFGPDPAASHLAEAPTILERLEVRLDGVDVRRDRGPNQDGLPRDLSVQGLLSLGGDRVVLDPLTVRAAGTVLSADGALDIAIPSLDDLLLDLRIDDGAAFSRAFGIPKYFDRLRARTLARGPFGSPSASGGRLTIGGLLSPGTTTEASFAMQDGRLELRVDTTDARLFGGQGKVSAQIGVFEGGSVSANPKLKATASLRGVDLAQLSGGLVTGRAQVELEVGDGSGGWARLDDVRVRGEATAESMTFAGSTYRNATVAFALHKDEVAIERLTLPIHRPLSPHFARDVTLPVGEIIIDGTLSLEDDPTLDLAVDASSVPMTTVMRLLETDLDVYGQIANAQLAVQGTVSQPSVDGRIAFEGLSASGIALGAGALDVRSEDYPRTGPLAGHRELRIQGELQQGKGKGAILWSVDSVVAIGTAPPGGAVPIEAQVDVEFDRVTLATLLRDPVDPTRSPPIEGELGEVSAHLLTCARGTTMLSDCVGVTPPADQDLSVSIAFAIETAWLRSATDPLPAGTDPCDSPTTLCTGGALSAAVEWPTVRLEEPWKLRTGGADGATLALAGSFDLSDSAVTSGPAEELACVPPRLRGAPVSPGAKGGETYAELSGAVDLAPLAALVRPYGVTTLEGRLELEVAMTGTLSAPHVAGRAGLASAGGSAVPLKVGLEALGSDVIFSDLRLELADDWLLADGAATLRGGTIEFGSVAGDNTGYALSGRCAGNYGAAAQGSLSANLLSSLVGPPLVGGPGGVGLRSLVVRGSTAQDMPEKVDASLAFDRTSLALEFSEGIASARLDRGRIEIHRCTSDCTDAERGWYRIDIGGSAGDGASDTQPSTALRMTAGTRGRGWVWGRAYLDESFARSTGVDIQVRLDGIPYRAYDTSGRPVYEVEIQSDDLELRGGTPLVVTGSAEIDRARYVKDAVQGVEILAFTDDSPEIEEPPPELLQGMTFDIRVETDRPFRIENNVASGLQADGIVQVTGTYEAPEFTGRLDFEPGGTVDIPFLTGTYEIQRGRVTLLRDLEDAEVDVLALRNEPIYIDDQPRSVQLQLGGTLSAIRWSCITDGGGSELDTVRGCTEYLVLGAGDVQLTENDVQQFGAGGLAGVRKPLQVVGHLTEFDVGERAGEAAPRLDPYIPDIRLRLGQIGPELEVATPTEWFDFDYGRATFGWDYTRGYPGFLLRQSRESSIKLEILDPITIEYSRRTRSYLNERVIFDPLEQRSIELRFDFDVPSLR